MNTTPDTASVSRPPANFGRAALWMLGTLSSILVMGISGRELSAELAPHHSSFYRNVVCLIILVPIVSMVGWQRVRTPFFKRHIARNSVHWCAQWCWLFGLGALPLAEVFAIEFSSADLDGVVRDTVSGERLTRWRVLAILLGFTGILIILRPGIAIIDPASLVVLAGALGYATTYVITKNIMGRDSALTVVFWMNAIQLPIGGVFVASNLIIPSWEIMPWVIALGVTGLSSHYCLSQALSNADATIVMPLDFFRLPLAAVVAWFLYSEAIDPFLALGALFILAGNWTNVRFR
jgi:drug/metabolite transporter (DMT)-like permease